VFFYFLLFCVTGFIIGTVLKDVKIAMITIVIITLFWALKYGPWALATLFELLLGFSVAKAAGKESYK
jgi:hypothetical protein